MVSLAEFADEGRSVGATSSAGLWGSAVCISAEPVGTLDVLRSLNGSSKFMVATVLCSERSRRDGSFYAFNVTE